MLKVEGVTGVDLSQSGITNIPDYTFKGKSLVSITVPDDTTIGTGAFQNCTKLTTVTGTLSEVGELAFRNCEKLTSVTVNGKVGYEAFASCSKLQHLRVGGGFDILGENAFSGVNKLTVYYGGPQNAENEEFRDKVLEQLEKTVTNVIDFKFGCTDEDWNSILESNKPEADPTPDNALARLILGL